MVIGCGHCRTGEAVRRGCAVWGWRPTRRYGTGAGVAVGPRHGVRTGFWARGIEKTERSAPLAGRRVVGPRFGQQTLRGGLVDEWLILRRWLLYRVGQLRYLSVPTFYEYSGAEQLSQGSV